MGSPELTQALREEAEGPEASWAPEGPLLPTPLLGR